MQVIKEFLTYSPWWGDLPFSFLGLSLQIINMYFFLSKIEYNYWIELKNIENIEFILNEGWVKEQKILKLHSPKSKSSG